MRGIIKAVGTNDAIQAGLARGIVVIPIRKHPHFDEWSCNFGDFTSVEEIYRWYCENAQEGNGQFRTGTLLFFSEGEYKL